MLAENPPYYVDQSHFAIRRQHDPGVFPEERVSQLSIRPNYDLTKVTIHAQDPNQRTPYVEQVSFGPQIEFSSNTVLDISYVGNFGRKEDRLRNANQGLVTGFTRRRARSRYFLTQI